MVSPIHYFKHYLTNDYYTTTCMPFNQTINLIDNKINLVLTDNQLCKKYTIQKCIITFKTP